MAFVLKLKSSTHEVDFLGPTYVLSDGGLKIDPPERDNVWGSVSKYGLGARLLDYTVNNRTISINFQVKTATRSAMLDAISTIETLLRTARERSINQEPTRVSLYYQWDGRATVTYFEIIDGTFRYPEDIMSVEQVVQYNGEVYTIVDCTLELVAHPYSYGISPVDGTPTEIPLKNGNTSGSYVTGGVTVYNQDDSDAGQDNWVDILGSDVIGDAPSITIIEITGVSTGGPPQRIAIGHRIESTPMPAHILEESAFTESAEVEATPLTGSGYSGGSADIYDFDNVNQVSLGYWTIQDSHVYGGQPYRAVAVAALGYPFDTDMNYQLRLTLPADENTIFYQTDWVSPLVEENYLDFGVIVLPPFKGITSVADLRLNLYGFRKFTGTSQFSIDYLYLLPIREGYRVLQNRVTSTSGGFGDKFVDNNWESIQYAEDGGDRLGIIDGLFSPIRLIPGKNQRLYFLFNDLFSFQPPTFSYTVRVYSIPLYVTMA